MTRVLLIPIFALQIGFLATAQQPAKPVSAAPAKRLSKNAPANDIFSGTVTASQPASVTVVRKVPARADEYRTFIVDQDTKTEGKLRVGARVSVRFKADSDGGIHAVHVIVRTDGKAAGRAAAAH